MEEMLVSFIIPVYNAEKYIANILSKLLPMQEKSQIPYEVILIDDGSTDQSAAICAAYVQRNGNCMLFRQKNAGASAARNQGIKQSHGKFICFLDSDDDIATTYVEEICALCKASEADVIQLDAYQGTQKSGYVYMKTALPEGLVEKETYSTYVLAQKTNAPWNKIYRASIIRENSIAFDTQMTIGEDISFVLLVLAHAKLIAVHHRALYYYYFNDEGLTAKVSAGHFDDFEKMYQNMQRYMTDTKMEKSAGQVAQQSMLRSYFRTVGLCCLQGIGKKEILQKLEHDTAYQEIVRGRYTALSDVLRQGLLKRMCTGIIAFLVAKKSDRRKKSNA